MKIINLVAENFKRIQAIDITPEGNTVVITGRNAQGKTSVLDAMWAALGGREGNTAKKPIREGADAAMVRVDLGDMVVTRKWVGDKTPTLRVESKDGAEYKSPQTLLDGLIGKMTFDPLAFTRLSVADQRKALMGLVTLDIDLDQLDADRASAFSKRTDVGRAGKDLGSEPVVDESLPADEVSASSLLSAIRAAQEDEQKRAALVEHHQWVAKRVADFEASLTAARNELTAATEDLASLPTAIADIDALGKELANVEETNATIRTNNQNRARVAQIAAKRDEYKALTAQIEQLDKQKTEALAKAEFPVPGLGFDENGVTFNAVPFSQASSAEQIRVSLAIAIALNPGLKVIRILDGSLLDDDGMRLVEEAAEANDYQIWIERVGDSGSVGIVIEDGQVKE